MQANVLVELKAKQVDKTFTYHVPTIYEDKIKVGIRVYVPFGRQKLEGFVLDVHNDKKYEYEIKDIISPIDDEPVINEEMINLGKFISKNTFSTLISAYQAMLPNALKAHHDFVVNKKYETYLEIINREYIPKSNATLKVLELFKNSDTVLRSVANKISTSAVNTLVKSKVLNVVTKEVYRIDDEEELEENNIILNKEQKEAVNKIKNSLNTYNPFLLYGVTGSGKTEVYMHIIEEVLKNKKEAIVLVPEISLTPQIVELFKKRFGKQVAILHSRLSDGEKYDEWRKIERKEVSIVVGARSAIFAPFTNLGIIIIDEEHTTTYKQENNPRYSAIDVALYRAKTYNCPVILGSATPSMESFTRAKENIYTLLTLKERVNKKLPLVTLVNMHDEMKKGNRVISDLLHDKISHALKNNEQVILLLNRRGYTTTLVCHDCGYTAKCPNCDIPLTYHKGINKLKCHYCNYVTNLITKCPECKSEKINNFGMGTEKLEAVIKEMFKEANVVRMDVDTTSRKGAHEKIISDFREYKYDILIGTQMISKGLDFPNVTLVGVINGDASLNIPDFRNSERTYQLLSQTSGRAGRGDKTGEVVIQAFNLDHYSIQLAKEHDYLKFYDEEINVRKILKYPPFCNLAFLYLKGKDLNVLNTNGKNIVNFLNNKLNKVVVLGPSMCMIPKINNIYNMQIIIKYKSLKEIYNALEYLNNYYKEKQNISFEIDINPLRI